MVAFRVSHDDGSVLDLSNLGPACCGDDLGAGCLGTGMDTRHSLPRSRTKSPDMLLSTKPPPHSIPTLTSWTKAKKDLLDDGAMI